jgi:hypothetical protein
MSTKSFLVAYAVASSNATTPCFEFKAIGVMDIPIFAEFFPSRILPINTFPYNLTMEYIWLHQVYIL